MEMEDWSNTAKPRRPRAAATTEASKDPQFRGSPAHTLISDFLSQNSETINFVVLRKNTRQMNSSEQMEKHNKPTFF